MRLMVQGNYRKGHGNREALCGTGGCISSVVSVELEKYSYMTENSIRFVKNYCLNIARTVKIQLNAPRKTTAYLIVKAFILILNLSRNRKIKTGTLYRSRWSCYSLFLMNNNTIIEFWFLMISKIGQPSKGDIIRLSCHAPRSTWFFRSYSVSFNNC